MKKYAFVFLFVFIPFINSFSQSNELKGVIIDKETQKPLYSANISLSEPQLFTTSDKNGEFSFTNLTDGNFTLIVSYVGYHTEKITVNLSQNSNQELNIEMLPTSISLGEVTVSSSKTEKLIKDVPIPIEVVSQDEIMMKPSISTSDILTDEAGVSIAKDGPWGSHINIRGMKRDNIVILVDGNRIETATNIAAGLSMVDLNDVKRIEIVKGGNSSLYGTGATGGVVNIFTSSYNYQDSFRFNGSFSSGYSSVNDMKSGNLSLNASSSKLYFGITGTVRDANNTRTPDGVLQNSQFSDKNISGKFGYKPFNNHEVILSYQNFHAKDVGIPGSSVFAPTASARYPTEDRQLYSFEYKIGNLSNLLSNLSVKLFHQYIGRNVEILPNANMIMNPSADHRIWGGQIQSNWILNNYNFLIFGVDMWQRNYDGIRLKTVKATGSVTAELPIPNATFRSVGFFAQDEFSFDEAVLRFLVGGRFDFINVKNDEAVNPLYTIIGGIRNDNPAGQTVIYEANEDNNYSWSGNVGMIYSLTKNLSTSFNAAHSFRSPSLEERFQYIQLGGYIYWGNPNLEPEVGNSFDLGLKFDNHSFYFSGNVFANYFTNLVIDQFNSVENNYYKTNIGKARLYGFDLSFEFVPVNKIILYSNAALVIGEDTYNDKFLPEIAPFNTRLGIKINSLEYVNFDLSSIIFAEQNKVSDGELTTPGYAVFSFYLSSKLLDFNFTDLQIFAGVENIFDKSYRNHLSTFRGIIKSEPGRNVFAKIKIGF
ncbi:MAG: TonB-dependent receptor [Ignavibacteriales bacterium]|nr:TonB-dependent receptor [Ignavibacteriales bacterium]